MKRVSHARNYWEADMGSFKAKKVEYTPAAPAAPTPTPEPEVRAKTRTKYAGAVAKQRETDEAKLAKKMLLGQ